MCIQSSKCTHTKAIIYTYNDHSGYLIRHVSLVLRSQVVAPLRIVLKRDLVLRNVALQQGHRLCVRHTCEVAVDDVAQTRAKAFFTGRILFLKVVEVVRTVF